MFPCAQVGGDKYIKALKTALAADSLDRGGRGDSANRRRLHSGGASAIGVGTELIPAQAIERREIDRILELAHRFRGFVNDARKRLAPQKDSNAATKTDFRKLHKQTLTR